MEVRALFVGFEIKASWQYIGAMQHFGAKASSSLNQKEGLADAKKHRSNLIVCCNTATTRSAHFFKVLLSEDPFYRPFLVAIFEHAEEKQTCKGVINRESGADKIYYDIHDGIIYEIFKLAREKADKDEPWMDRLTHRLHIRAQTGRTSFYA